MVRIKSFDMSREDIVVELCDGNPGALTVMMQMIENNAQIDPDDAFGSLGALLSLDSEGIYGTDIWVLYKDVCGEDLIKTLAFLRASQLGLFEEQILPGLTQGPSDLKDTLRDKSETIVALVQKRLPNFAKELEEDAA